MADDSIRNKAMSFLLKDEISVPKETPSYTLYEEKEDNSQENKKDLLIEKLAALEHEQWMEWAKSLMSKESLSKERTDRWEKECFMPYEDLSEETKEFDREWAYKVLDIVKGTNIPESNLNAVQPELGGLNEVSDTDLPDLSNAFEQVLENKTNNCVEEIEKVRERFTSNIREDIMKDMF